MENEEVVEKPADTSIRSGLEQAFEAASSPASAPAPSAAPVPAGVSASPAPASAPAAPSSGDTSAAAAAADSAEAAAALAAGRPIPERLKAKWADKWEKLDPAVRDEFHEYESNIGRVTSKYGKAAKAWEDAQRAFAPYAEMVRAEGGNYHAAVSNLFETARILRQGVPEQKIALVQQICQSFGIPLKALVGQPGADGQLTPPAPGASPELISRLTALERQVLTRGAEDEHNLRQKVNSDLETFLADPANVYLQEPGYLDTMAALIQSGKASDLPGAYSQAAWLHERTRQLEIAKINGQRTQQLAGQAQRARAVAVSANGNAPGNVKPDPAKMSLREALSAAMDGELE